MQTEKKEILFNKIQFMIELEMKINQIFDFIYFFL